MFGLLLEYADVLALNNECLGRARVLQYQIPNGHTAPICQQFCRMCPQKRQEMRNLLSDMLVKDIILPSSSLLPFLLKVTLLIKTIILAIIIIAS